VVTASRARPSGRLCETANARIAHSWIVDGRGERRSNRKSKRLWYGKRGDKQTNSLAIPETVYKTASLSKPFIAAAILLLMQEGQIGLDDKPYSEQPITDVIRSVYPVPLSASPGDKMGK
jgi:hypothetical protein